MYLQYYPETNAVVKFSNEKIIPWFYRQLVGAKKLPIQRAVMEYFSKICFRFPTGPNPTVTCEFHYGEGKNIQSRQTLFYCVLYVQQYTTVASSDQSGY